MTMDAAELTLIRSSFEGALRDTPAEAIVEALTTLGWDELRQAEPMVAVAELFEAQGRLLAATPMLDAVVADALSVEISAGRAMVHPGLGAWDAPPGTTESEGHVVFEGIVLTGLDRAARLLVPYTTPDGRTGVASAETADLELVPIAGFDETMRLARVRGRVAGADPPAAGVPWRTATAAARRALAHELCGLAQQMLDTAARHVTDRHQFGKPIAAFQSVRHRLTEVHVAIAATRPVLDAAWVTGHPLAADAAKALAGRAGHLASKHCLQVTGAIGFTWEYDLHRQMRRVLLLDGLYGRARALQTSIGADLLARGAVPRIHPLP